MKLLDSTTLHCSGLNQPDIAWVERMALWVKKDHIFCFYYYNKLSLVMMHLEFSTTGVSRVCYGFSDILYACYIANKAFEP
jgi:hypothetical protein